MAHQDDGTTITGAELRCLREHMGLSQAWLAQRMRVSQAAESAWELGVTPVPSWAADQLEAIGETFQGIVTRKSREPGDTLYISKGNKIEGDMPASWFRAVTFEAADQSGKQIQYEK